MMFRKELFLSSLVIVYAIFIFLTSAEGECWTERYLDKGVSNWCPTIEYLAFWERPYQ